ncbi:MAG: ATP-binding protein [Thermomicrobiales bacterium]
MSKLDSGVAAPDLQWHVLEELIGVAVGRTRSHLAQHTVKVDLPADLPLLKVDGILLEQVLINLLENAAQYSPPGSRVDVSAAVEGAWLIVRVADNGPGLTPGTEEKVFEKFFRGVTHPDARRGSGLGLAICRAVVQLHGGTITAANRTSGGALFTIRLPLSSDAPHVRTD